MKEKVVEILVLIMSEIQGNKRITDIDMQALQNKGYTPSEINAAISWIYDNMQLNDREHRIPSEARTGSRRVFHSAEKSVIPTEAQGYLLQLQELGLIDDRDLEMVIDRAMMSGYEKISIEELQEIVASVISAKGGGKGFMLNMGDSIH